MNAAGLLPAADLERWADEVGLHHSQPAVSSFR